VEEAWRREVEEVGGLKVGCHEDMGGNIDRVEVVGTYDLKEIIQGE